jgi:Domain of unknown function (DUF4166)
MTLLPFQGALGPAIESAAPGIRERFLQPSGTRRYRGAMRRIWRREGWQGRAAGAFLWLGSRAETLFADTGADIPFELENSVTRLADGRAAMTWVRAFHFPRGTRRFSATMVYDPARGAIVDWLGRRGHLEVELHPRVEEGGIAIDSGRQRLRLGRWWLPLPGWLAGRARIREWQEPDGSFGIRVTVSNPLLGDFFGYEGTFTAEA